jgi:hypothetical protein
MKYTILILLVFVSFLFFINDSSISFGAEPVTMVKSNVLIDNMLKKIDAIQRNFDEKDYFPKVPPYPSDQETNEIVRYVDRNVRDLRSLGQCWFFLLLKIPVIEK